MSLLRAVLLGSIVAASPAQAKKHIAGSSAFCLYELPTDDSGKRRWINLGIVQMIEVTAGEVKIFYGAGNFGSGHEVKIAIIKPEEANALLEKLRKAATACR